MNDNFPLSSQKNISKGIAKDRITMKLQIIPYLKRFIRILNNYLHWPDDRIRNFTFDIFEEIIKFAWKRISCYYQSIIQNFSEVSEAIINEFGRNSFHIERIEIICVLLFHSNPNSMKYKENFLVNISYFEILV